MTPHLIMRHEIFDLVMVAAPILLADLETGEILHATPAMERMFGCKLIGGMVGKNVDDLVPERLREKHKGLRDAYKESPRPLSTSSAMTMSGGNRLVGVRMDDAREFELQIGLVPGQLPSGRQRVVMVVAISL